MTQEKRIENLESEADLFRRDIIALKKLIIELCSFAIARDDFSHLSTSNLYRANKLYTALKDGN